MEHFALEILVKKEDGEIRYTQAADEFSDRFEEILIDEYQDSNLVQETLLQSVSQLRFGQHNLFMVGDVKQSIYRFRLARPELLWKNTKPTVWKTVYVRGSTYTKTSEAEPGCSKGSIRSFTGSWERIWERWNTMQMRIVSGCGI